MPAITLKVSGMEKLQKKLDGKFLVQPEVEHLRDALVTRVQRPRRGEGFLRNPLAIQKQPFVMRGGSVPIANLGTPLNRPRTTGRRWTQFIVGLVKGSFMQRQLASAAKKIEARFGQ